MPSAWPVGSVLGDSRDSVAQRVLKLRCRVAAPLSGLGLEADPVFWGALFVINSPERKQATSTHSRVDEEGATSP